MLNILIFPSGSKIAKEIYDSLKYDPNINIIGGEDNENNFTSFLYKTSIFNIPLIKDEELLINYLNKIICQYNIHYIYPAYNTVNLFLSKNIDKINCKIIVSNYETNNICLYVNKIYELFNKNINLPIMYNENYIEYPCLIRPNEFFIRKQTTRINNTEELEFYKKKVNNYILLEYLPGEEFIIDCFTNKTGKLIFCKGRQRKKTSLGVTIYAYESNTNFRDIAEKINNVLKFNGVWFFEIKYDINGIYKLVKICPRVANSMTLYRNKGVNFPLLTIKHFEGELIDKILYNNCNIECYKIYENIYKHNIQYKTVYIELDNTIIIKNNINLKIIKYLYNCINKKINIILLTRNYDVKNILERYKINEKIFDEIIIIEQNAKKSNFVKSNSIYIDSSFKDRYDVYVYKNINVFDLDMIEILLDIKY
jgi:hypothetical protein